MKLLPRIIGRGCECCRLFKRVCVFGWGVSVCVCAGRGSAGLMAAPLDGERGTGGG